MYKKIIQKLIDQTPLEIDSKLHIQGRSPTMANSEFLTNKEQGDWAERVVLQAINELSSDSGYFAIKYGRSDKIAAGDQGFKDFYQAYQKELNTIGKKPDILIYKTSDFSIKDDVDLENDAHIEKAIAALEVRSSSFLSKEYTAFIDNRQNETITNCMNIRQEILSNPNFRDILIKKNLTIYNLISEAIPETFKELDFRCPSWSSTQNLKELTSLLKKLKHNIKILQKRDYLSITPKVEDIALVNRWIQKYNVKHFYLQVFFDKAYISFLNILELVCNDKNKGINFSIEKDVKNQGKTTIKVNVKVGKEIIGKIDMPQHKSALKKLDRGRLLFYVTFEDGKGYLDQEIFLREIINA